MGRAGMRRRRRPVARRPGGHPAGDDRAADHRPGGAARFARSPWLLTWLHTVLLAAMVAVGPAVAGRQPSDDDERAVLLLAGVVTLPGVVPVVVAAVRRTRQARDGSRPRYQRLLDAAKPAAAASAPNLPRSVAADVMVTVIGWCFAVAGLDIVLALVLVATPVDEWWATLPALPIVGSAALALAVLLAGIAWLAFAVLRTAVVGDPDAVLVRVPAAPPRPDRRMDPVYRAMLVLLGVCLAGMATFGIPMVVLELVLEADVPGGVAGAFTARADGAAAHAGSGAVGWLAALRVTVAMTLGGLAGVVALSPIAYQRMVAGPRRRRAAGESVPNEAQPSRVDPV